MGKIIKLSQSDLNKIINKIVTEQTSIFEAESDVSDMITNFNSTASRESRLKMMNVQRKLKQLGYDLGEFGPKKDGIDGKYGNLTFNAIVDFQKKNKIKPTGWVGKLTAPLLGVEPMESGTYRYTGKKTQTSPKDPNKNTNDKKVSQNNNDKKIVQDKTIKPSDVGYCIGLPKENCDKISSTQVVNQGSAETKECAQFVSNRLRAFDGKYFTGNAWKASSNLKGGGGTEKFNLFKSLPWESIYQQLKTNPMITKSDCEAFAGKEKSDYFTVREKSKKILNIANSYIPKNSGLNISILKPGDVVGIWHRDSHNKGRAFCERMIEDLKLDDKGNFKKLPFTFNTHVGYVTSIKNGVPIIAHNINGTYFTVPATKMLSLSDSDMIAWVISDNEVQQGIAAKYSTKSNRV